MSAVHNVIIPEEIHRLEIAQEILGMLIAHCSESIYLERQKAQPNVNAIDRWRAECADLFILRHGLICDDMRAIEDVIVTYGPRSRSAFAAI